MHVDGLKLFWKAWESFLEAANNTRIKKKKSGGEEPEEREEDRMESDYQ